MYFVIVLELLIQELINFHRFSTIIIIRMNYPHENSDASAQSSFVLISLRHSTLDLISSS